jgi:predicted DNA-binding transcriptional regulator AlpA
MRKLNSNTVGKILEELNKELREKFLKDNPGTDEDEVPGISRATFYRLEKRLKFPVTRTSSGNKGWRTYTREEMEEIKKKIKKEYNLV